MNPYAPWQPPFRYDDKGANIVDANGRLLADLRGWGFLTGHGTAAKGLPFDEANQVLASIGCRVALLLNLDVKECEQNAPHPDEPTSDLGRQIAAVSSKIFSKTEPV